MYIYIHSGGWLKWTGITVLCSVLQAAAVHFNTLHCAAVCCKMLQYMHVDTQFIEFLCCHFVKPWRSPNGP